jgi:GT2 family glycosyltransferase
MSQPVARPNESHPEHFDAYYFAHGCGHPYQRDETWLRLFENIAARIITDIHPRIVLDAGCAFGFLVEALRQRGVKAWGIDLSAYAIQSVHESIKTYCAVGSVAQPLTRHYDLIVCIEVLEHLPQPEAEAAIANFCAHTEDILFSSSPFDYTEVTHLNVQPIDYWAAQFARHGFIRDVDFDASFITPWAGRFRRNSDAAFRWVQSYERKLWALSQENHGLRQTALAQQQRLSQLQAHQARWTDIEQSIGWRLLQQLQMARAWLLPPGSRRDQWLEQLWRSWREQAQSAKAQHSTRTPAPTASGVSNPTESAAHSDTYQQWFKAHAPSPAELAQQREAARHWQYQPLISFIVPVYNPPPDVLKAMLDSVLAQTYTHWEVCLADGNSEPAVRAILADYTTRDRRVRVTYLRQNQGIVGNSNAALSIAQGEFIGLLDHDDLLEPHFLYEVVYWLNTAAGAETDIIYFDEDKVSADGAQLSQPMFKPHCWTPELMLSANCLMHSVVRRQLVWDVGAFTPHTEGAQDWDLLLRCVERTTKIAHIPKILYHWRQLPGSAASSVAAKPWVIELQPQVIANHLRRQDLTDVSYQLLAPGKFHFTWQGNHTKVSIIIPTQDHFELLRQCLNSLFQLTAYPDYEVILIDSGSHDERVLNYYQNSLSKNCRVRLFHYSEPFNYSAVNNVGVRESTGELLLFLNNDVEVLEAGWLSELARWAERPNIGAVGAKLLYPDGRIQHAGVVLGLGHIFSDAPEDFMSSWWGSPNWYRNYMAVTGACLMVRRAVFEQVGGFDERFKLAFGDVELCARIVKAGYRNVYTPYARLRHHEGATRANRVPIEDQRMVNELMRELWIQADPYYNPNLFFGDAPQVVEREHRLKLEW